MRREERPDAMLREGSPSRQRLLELAAGEARRKALLLDPGLAARGVAAGDFTEEDVVEVRQAVLAARRLLGAEPAVSRRSSQRLSSLVVAFAALLVFLMPAGVERAVDSALGGAVPTVDSAAITRPTVEAIAPAGARVYELTNEEFSVVWFIDESFDV